MRGERLLVDDATTAIEEDRPAVRDAMMRASGGSRSLSAALDSMRQLSIGLGVTQCRHCRRGGTHRSENFVLDAPS